MAGEQYVDLTGLFDPPVFGTILLPSTQTEVLAGLGGLVKFGSFQPQGGSVVHPLGMAGAVKFGFMSAAITEIELPSDLPVGIVAALPFYEAQRILRLGHTSTAGVDAVAAVCGWHGQTFDDRRGSFALANPEGSCAGLVGERVRVVAQEGGAEVFALVVDTADVPDDLSLARRPFMEIGLLTEDSVRVTVLEAEDG